MISVCIASFNGEKYIVEQLNSILCQLGNTDEVIISDDGSTDSTIEKIVNLCDQRIRLIQNNSKKGLISNFENALRMAKGDIIFLADQDDIWFPNKVSVCIDYLKSSDIVLSDCIVVDENLKTIYPSFFEVNNSKSGLINNLIKNSYIGCCMTFKKEVLTIALPFPEKIPMHDIWVGFIGELFFKTNFISIPLVQYRRHSQNASISANKSNFSIWQKISFRFNTIRYIFDAYFRYVKYRK